MSCRLSWDGESQINGVAWLHTGVEKARAHLDAQHAVGVKRNDRAAELMYRSAITCQSITDFAREEAMYHLAVLLLGKPKPNRREAKKLLLDASADGDYPEAETFLLSLNSSEPMTICICRRHLRPRLAKRHCPVHGPREVRCHPSIVV